MRPINRVKLTENIVEAIVEYASSQNLKTGDRLPSERELANALMVSRPLLREALRKMESLNLIEVLPGRGIFVKTPLKNNMSYLVLHIDGNKKNLEILKVRRVLEKLAVEEAIKNITASEVEELERKLNLLEEKQRRGEDSREANWTFHSLIYRTANNKLLFNILEGLKDFHLFWEDPFECPSFAEKTYFFHRELFRCIEKRDPEKACILIDRLMDALENEIKKDGENF